MPPPSWLPSKSISAGQLTDDVQSYFNANFTRSDVKNLQGQCE